jgi:Transcriptional regulatory protein, C terminal
VEFRILGPLEVADGDSPVALAGTRARALLALLLTSANEVVSSDRLIDELWGAQPPRSAARATVAATAKVPTLFVRRGPRPGGLAPNETLTRFTWTLGSP